MDRTTVDIYEKGAERYWEERRAYHPDRAAAFAQSLPEGALRVDLGCGPGHYLPHLGTPVIAADAAEAMVVEARRHAPTVDPARPLPGVVCDVEALPFRRGGLDGIWASKVFQHVPAERFPMALTQLQRALSVGGVLDLTVFSGQGAVVSSDDDEFPGRLFTWWRPETLESLLEGAGFTVETVDVLDGRHENRPVAAVARRARTLPDTVGAGMRLLISGLNPSLYAADAGIGFARPGNRFWPAALAAGLVSADRDPDAALHDHGVGMTDIVKRATVAAAELTKDEYRAGMWRLEHLVGWLRPAAICFVGLAGWRAAVDPKAVAGVQPALLADVPVYVMPSTSGLNASSSLADLTAHFRQAAALADLHAGER
jgi:TDG/mug DNA glycosylase family protein